MSFHATCKTLRSVAPPSSIKFQTFSPVLMFLKCLGGICNIVDPKYAEVCHMNMAQSQQDVRICFSKNGWLLMMKHEPMNIIDPVTPPYLFFFNPFTKEVIELPRLPDEQPTSLVNVAFSSPPTSPNCWIVILLYYARKLHIYFKRLDHEDWDIIVKKKKSFDVGNIAPVFFDGAFYFLSSNGIVCYLHLDEKDGRIIHSWKVVIKPQDRWSWKPNYLVECDGKLLAIRVGDVGESVEVMKLNASKKVWENVQSLGQHMLFISPISCFSAVAKVAGMENKIYFPRLVD